VGSDFPMTDLAAIEQFHQLGPGNIQQVGRTPVAHSVLSTTMQS
jgi:hypothetical protein